MPYTQKWGISRNAFQSPLKELETDINTDPNIDVDNDIITQNNENADDDGVYYGTEALDEVVVQGSKSKNPDRNKKLDAYFNWDNWKGNVDDLSDAEWDARQQFQIYKHQGKDPFSDEYKDVHTKFMSKYGTEGDETVDMNQYGVKPQSSSWITPKKASNEPTPDLSQERADQIGAEFKRREDGDSAWDQLGTLVSNPFQGTVALANQTSEAVRSLMGNPTNIQTRRDSLANLTNLKMAKEGEESSGIINPELQNSNAFNNATQWIPHAVLASSIHQGATGGGQILKGDVKKGAKNVGGAVFSYLPGVRQLRKMGGVKGVTSKFDKVTGPMIANIAPTLNKLTTNLANKIDANKASRIASALIDKGGTYTYKTNKAVKQASMKSSS